MTSKENERAEFVWAVLQVALVLAGAGVIYSGWDELQLSSGTSVDPVPVDLAALERGEEPPDRHIEIGPHVRVFRKVLLTHLATGGDPVQASTRLVTVHYPIVSPGHPYTKGECEEPDGFRVLVRDDSFEQVGGIPDRDLRADSLRGLVITDVARWSDEREAEFAKAFPGVDRQRLLIVERGRAPLPASGGGIRLALGAVLVVTGFFGRHLLRRAFRRQPVSAE